jgi:peptidoglycan/LPS O-acetylase OafA/YrhL
MGVRAVVLSAVALALGAFIYLAVFLQGTGPNNTFGPSLRILETVVGTSGLILMIAGALGIGASATLYTLSRISTHRVTVPADDVPQEVQIVL